MTLQHSNHLSFVLDSHKSLRRFLIITLLIMLAFAAQPVQEVQAANAAEIASLTDLYNDLGGPGWWTSTNWLVGDPCTNNWYGVTCDGAGNVTAIRLANNRLIGNIDDVDLSGLTWLELLFLHNNQIGGNIDGFDLTHNTALVRLYLYNNQIGGSIDGFDLTNNTALVDLYLFGNQIGGSIDGFDLTNNTALEVLYLQYNQIGGSIDGFDLTNNTALVILNLNNNQIYGPLPAWLDGTTSSFINLNLSYNRCLQPSLIPAVDNYVTSLDSDWQTSNTDCTLVATATCSGADLLVTVTAGDPFFTIAASDPGGTIRTGALPTGGSTILGSGAGYGTWTNITVVEGSGNMETLNLADLTCGSTTAATTSSSGSCPSCPATTSSQAALTIDVIPPTDPANTSQGDGRGIFVLDDTPTWVIEVTNPNAAAVDDVVAQAQIDKAVEITNITPSQGNASADAENVVTMVLGTLNSGETATITVETKVVPVGEVCTSGWLNYQQANDTECVDLYLLPGTLPATGGSPRRMADLWAEMLAGGVMLSVALGWVWIKRRRKA